MSYKQCLSNALNEGTITKDQYDNQLELFNDLEKTYRTQGLSPDEARAKASQESFRQFKSNAFHKKRNDFLTMQRQAELKNKLEQYRNIKGEIDYANAAKAIFARDDLAKYPSLETVIQEEYSIVQKYLDELLSELRTGPLEKAGGLIGIKNKKKQTLQVNFLKALYGEPVNDQVAKNIAEAFVKANQLSVQRFNKFGGRLIARQDWRIPQPHDFIKVRKVNKEAWIDFISPLLNVEKMIDNISGLPFSPEKLRLALGDVYETISTQGLNKLKPGDFGKTSLANKRLDSRFLIFKNSDAWFKYQNAFGTKGNILEIVNDHLTSISRDTALMRVLGPNPDRGYQWLKQTVMKKAAIDASKEAKGEFKRKRLGFSTEEERATAIFGGGISEAGIDNLYLLFKNQLNKPSDKPWARGFAGLRQLITSAYLGSASIVALTDFNWQRITNQFNGLPAFKSARRTLSLFKEGLLKGDKTMAKAAIRSGLIAESWTSYAHQQTRYLFEVNGSELTQRLADATITLSGLSGMTQAGRWGFGMEFMGYMADAVSKTFNELPKGFQKTLSRYGIGANDWDIARKTKLYNAEIDDPKALGQNITFLRPDDIRIRKDLPDQYSEDLATKFFDMIKTETEYAVPSVSAKGRAWILGNAKPGTFIGELALSAAMFKQFPITLMFTHVNRGLMQSGFAGKFRYMGDLIVTGAMYGAFTMEVREITKGRNPTPLNYIAENPGEYFLRALVTGGGLGLFGDYFIADHNRYGKTLSETIPGPQLQFLSDVYGLSIGQVMKLIRGEDTNFIGSSLSFLKRNMPGGSIWYLRLIWERMIMDSVARMVDKDFDSKNSRTINNYLRNTQQDYWWQPGETLPEQAPLVR